MTPDTIITGCGLWIPAEGKSLWGDLWRIGGVPGPATYIFNGVLWNHEASWQFEHRTLAQVEAMPEKVLIITGQYFERRAVVVVSELAVTLNKAAKEYLK